MLVAPLLVFVLIVFVVPILIMIWRSVYNPEIRDFLPQTAAALSHWDGKDVPSEEVFRALASDMIVGVQDRTIGRAAARINREIPGARSTVMRTARKVDNWSAPYREKFLEADKDWANLEFWHILKRETRVRDAGLLSAGGRLRVQAGRDDRAATGGLPGLQGAFPPHCLDEPVDHGHLRPARLSGILSPGDAPCADRQSPDDPGPAAVLDIAPGPNLSLDRAAAEGRRHQRPAGHDRASSTRTSGCG